MPEVSTLEINQRKKLRIAHGNGPKRTFLYGDDIMGCDMFPQGTEGHPEQRRTAREYVRSIHCGNVMHTRLN
jgi:hypothetical protein